MASKLAEKAPGWSTRILVPELVEIKGELKNINTRIDAVSTRIEELDKRLSAKIDHIDEKLSNKIEDLDKRLDIVQRLSVLEAKVKEKQKSVKG